MSRWKPPGTPVKIRIENRMYLGNGRWGVFVDGQVRFLQETPGGLRDTTEETELLCALEFGPDWKQRARERVEALLRKPVTP